MGEPAFSFPSKAHCELQVEKTLAWLSKDSQKEASLTKCCFVETENK